MREIVSPLDGFRSPFGRISGLGGAFDPASLFASGEQGAWYEPSTTTCFTDTAGTTAAGVDDAVARINDLSGNGNHATQGTAAARPILKAAYDGVGALGSELVANGTFDTDLTGWTDNSSAGGAIAWNAGRVDLVNTTGTSRLEQDVPVIAGRVYAITVQAVALGGSTSSHVYLDGSALPAMSFYLLGVGTHTIYYVAPDTSLNLSARNFTTGTTVTLDNISVKEIPEDSRLYYLEDDEVDDALNWTAPADTDYTVAYVNSSGTVTILTGQSLSGATDILLDPELVAYIAADRGLTAGETSGLTSYLEALA